MLVYEYMPKKSLDVFLFDEGHRGILDWRKRSIIIEGVDFGMARIFGSDQDQADTRRVVGTYGYMAPEYAMEGRFSEKSDVFSFGVLAWKLWKEQDLSTFTDSFILNPSTKMEIRKCMQIGLLCVQEFAEDRPSISSVLAMLTTEKLFTNNLLMDDDGLNMRNWGYYEPSLKGHLGLQLMSSVVDRDTKPFLTRRENPIMLGANGVYHCRDSIIPEAPLSHIDYVRDSWINHRDKFLHMFPGNPYTTVLPETSASHSMQMVQQPDASKDVRVNAEEPELLSVKKESIGPSKRKTGGATPKAPKAKKSKKASSAPKENGIQRTKPAKKSMDIVINGIDMDISGIPIPVCSCTGAPQQCYRWGCGGWQSACCTTSISMYPLPMSTKRRGARIAGRKMSQGAFKKVLEKLAAEGYNFANPIDLRTHWAKHGTNKFVTIR
ncbi:hypothetical protein K7X08_001274 [Anisodus acutangulus]|uniref:GAGA-binding transcriptional activator n=1 Tax=Anisodus acutangulus TaxID=402998 RepID=A0A9Q1RMW0_9SOLA|nr:hypothetical protein K7X08_001274 [Anisodus acutangulus]